MSYITLAQAKEWLQITGSTYDAIITDMLATADEAIDDYCGTTFTEQTVTDEPFDGDRSDTIVPKNYPITTVQAVTVGLGIGTGGALLDPTEYDVQPEAVYLLHATTGAGRLRGKISYKWGYTAVPARVKQAEKFAVEGWFRAWQRKSVGVTSKSKEGESVSFKGAWDGTSGLPVEAVSLLQGFRDVGFPGPSPMTARRY